MTNKINGTLLVVAFAVIAWQSYSCGQAKSASRAFRDSLLTERDTRALVQAAQDSVDAVRDSVDFARTEEIGTLNAILTQNKIAYERSRLRATAQVEALESILRGASDTVRVAVLDVVDTLQSAVASCGLALANCEQIQSTQHLQVLARDSTIAERDTTIADLVADLRNTEDKALEFERKAHPGLLKRFEYALPFLAALAVAMSLFK